MNHGLITTLVVSDYTVGILRIIDSDRIDI
jgi:hypothetical protein